MAKTILDKNIEEIKKILKEKKYIIGTETGIKNLKQGKTEKIFLASNCNPETKKEIEHLAKISNTEIVLLKQPNDELSTICKKPFSISMLSTLKKWP